MDQNVSSDFPGQQDSQERIGRGGDHSNLKFAHFSLEQKEMY